MLNYLLFLLLPIYLFYFPITNYFSINLLELLLIITILVNSYTILKETSINYLFSLAKQRKHSLLPIILILIGFTFNYFRQQLLTDWINWTDGFGKLLDLIILPILYGFSLIILLKLKKLASLKLFLYYYCSTILIALLGTFYFINHWLTFDNRLSIFFESPNQLAIFISPAILIGLFNLFIQKTNHLPKYILIPSLILLFFCLYKTYSLGAWLGLLFSTSYLFIFLKNKYFYIYSKLIFSIIIFSLLAILNIDLILKTINYQQNIPANSYDSRLAIYQVDQRIISTNWLYGVGINNFQNTYLSQQKYFPFYPQWAVPHAHNMLIHLWIEGGLLAGIGFILLIYNLLLSNNTSLLQSKQPYSILFFSIFIYFIIHGLIDTPVWTASSAIIFFAIILILIHHTEELTSRHKSTL